MHLQAEGPSSDWLLGKGGGESGRIRLSTQAKKSYLRFRHPQPHPELTLMLSAWKGVCICWGRLLWGY